MKDMLDVKSCEITIDRNGKIWVNVNGICKLRIRSAKLITLDDPIRGFEILKGKP